MGVDPQLDRPEMPGVPPGYTLERFCCEIVKACAKYVVAIKPQLAFFEARGMAGMHAFVQVLKTARRLNLLTIADAKRSDIGTTSEAYAEAFLGDGDFACDAVTVNAYTGEDGIIPFVDAAKRRNKGLFVCVKTSNKSSADLQDRETDGVTVWQSLAQSVEKWGHGLIGRSGLSSVGAVVGATYPQYAVQARELMPHATIMVPGYGAQGGTAMDAVQAARSDGTGVIVNASRSLMYAYRQYPDMTPAVAAAHAAEDMRDKLNKALIARWPELTSDSDSASCSRVTNAVAFAR